MLLARCQQVAKQWLSARRRLFDPYHHHNTPSIATSSPVLHRPVSHISSVMSPEEREHWDIPPSTKTYLNGRQSQGPSFFDSAIIGKIEGGSTFIAAQRDVNISHYHHQGLASKGSFDAETQRLLDLIRGYSRNRFLDIHHDIVSQRAPRTGDTFQARETVQEWVTTPNSFLWATGGPGAGKTYLMSVMVELLGKRAEERSDIATASAYLRYTEQLTTWDIVVSVITQIVESRPLPAVTSILEKGLERHERMGTRPSLSELTSILQQIVQHYSQAFVNIDGLDEMPTPVQTEIVEIVSSIKANVLITSRHLRLLQKKLVQLRAQKPVFINVVALPEDLDLYVTHIIARTPEFGQVLDQHNMKEEVLEKIKKKADGMFLHAKLQLEAIRDCMNPKDIREELDRFPPGIEGLYATTMGRIQRQMPRHAALAVYALAWLVHAEGTLCVEDLQYAVTFSPATYQYDKDRIVTEDHLLSICCGLVTVDVDTRQIRLVHYSAQNALQPILQYHFHHPHEIIARACITRLAECGLQSFSFTASKLKDTFADNPLLEYAYLHMSKHFHQEPESMARLQPLVESFIRGCESFPYLHQFFPSDAQYLHHLTPIHITALYNLPTLLFDLISTKGSNVNSRATQMDEASSTHPGWSALMFASAQGNTEAVAQLLSLAGVNTNLVDRIEQSALMLAAGQGHHKVVALLMGAPGCNINLLSEGWSALMLACHFGHHLAVEQLLLGPEIDVNIVDGQGWSALLKAASRGHELVVRLLLAVTDIDVNQADELGWTPLMDASYFGHETVVEILLSRPDLQVNAVDQNKWSALMKAASSGNELHVRRLLATTNIDVNLVEEDEWTPLMMACHRGHEKVLDVLLSDPNVLLNVGDDQKWSALMHAAAEGHVLAVSRLLAVPNVDVNLVKEDGWTPLMIASFHGHGAVIDLLLSTPDVLVNAVDNRGWTALMHAADEGHVHIVAHLLNVPDIDSGVNNKKGQSALDLALSKGHDGVVRLLNAL